MLQRETTCRSCKSTHLVDFLHLGNLPLANALLSSPTEFSSESRFPLTVAMCDVCALVQLRETVDPSLLFSSYPYCSSFADTMVESMRSLAWRQIQERDLTRDDLVLEIASNDGYLLQFYHQKGIAVLGIDPAQNIAPLAIQKGIPTIVDFFGLATAKRLFEAGYHPRIIHAHNVLAHVGDLNGFVAGIALLLKKEGVAIIEVPSLLDLLESGAFDTIYHEHLSYFSLTALGHLFRRHGLFIEDVEHLSLHGGSFRLFVGHEDQPSPRVHQTLTQESVGGIHDLSTYQTFHKRVTHVTQEVLEHLRRFKRQGKTIAVYGASAKGSTFMNVAGITRDLVDYVVDRSSLKQGWYTPGNHLPIHDPSHLLKLKPDVTLLLSWNFANEILSQQKEYLDQGGKFLLPLPQCQMVDRSSHAA